MSWSYQSYFDIIPPTPVGVKDAPLSGAAYDIVKKESVLHRLGVLERVVETKEVRQTNASHRDQVLHSLNTIKCHIKEHNWSLNYGTIKWLNEIYHLYR